MILRANPFQLPELSPAAHERRGNPAPQWCRVGRGLLLPLDSAPLGERITILPERTLHRNGAGEVEGLF